MSRVKATFLVVVPPTVVSTSAVVGVTGRPDQHTPRTRWTSWATPMPTTLGPPRRYPVAGPRRSTSAGTPVGRRLTPVRRTGPRTFAVAAEAAIASGKLVPVATKMPGRVVPKKRADTALAVA